MSNANKTALRVGSCKVAVLLGRVADTALRTCLGVELDSGGIEALVFAFHTTAKFG